MQPSEKFTELMINFEGEKLVGYKDSKGLPTIGIGHLIRAGEPYAVRKSITKEESRRLFAQDTKAAVDAVNTLVKVPLTQNQFDALCSFVFNLGKEKFANSTLLKLINQKNFAAAANEFGKWNKQTVNGKLVEVKGLTTRRAAEKALFEKK